MIGPAALAILSWSAPPVVSSDAPDHANGTVTVPPGAVQAEIGVDVTLPGSGRVEQIVPVHIPTALRIGLTRRIELRAFDGEPMLQADPNRRVGGDTAFGLKIRFDDGPYMTSRRPSFGIEPFLSTSTLRLFRDIETLGLGATLLWTQTVSRWLVFDANLGAEIGVGETDVPVSGFAAVSAQIVASSKWIPYAEVYFEVPTHAPETIDVGGDAGFIVIAHPRLALDLAGRVTMLTEGPDYGVIAGIAVVLADGKRWRRWARKSI